MWKQDLFLIFFGMQDFGIDFFSMGDLKVCKCYEVWRIWDAFFWYAGFEFQKAGKKGGMQDWAPPRETPPLRESLRKENSPLDSLGKVHHTVKWQKIYFITFGLI